MSRLPMLQIIVHKLELRLTKLKESGLKFNTKKSFFGKTKMEYLCFWVTRDGVKPIGKEIDNKTYDSTDFSKKSVLVYKSSKLLS